MIILLISGGSSAVVPIPVAGSTVVSTARVNAPTVTVQVRVQVGTIVSTAHLLPPMVIVEVVVKDVTGGTITSTVTLLPPSVLTDIEVLDVIAGHIPSGAQVFEPEEIDQPSVFCMYGGIRHPVSAEMVLEVRRPQLDVLRASLVSQGWRVIHTTKLTASRYRILASCIGNLDGR